MFVALIIIAILSAVIVSVPFVVSAADEAIAHRHMVKRLAWQRENFKADTVKIAAFVNQGLPAYGADDTAEDIDASMEYVLANRVR